MEIEEFAKKYLGLELKPYQVEWLKATLEKKGERALILAPRMKGMSCDMITFDDIKEVLKK